MTFTAKYTLDYELAVTSFCLKVPGIVHIVEIYLVKDTSRIGCPQWSKQIIYRKVYITSKQGFQQTQKPF